MGLRPWGHQADAVDALLANGGGGVIRDLFLGLLSNPTYRAYPGKEVRRHLEGALRPENVLRHIARQRDLVAPAMEKEIETFFRPGGREVWVRNVAEMESFAKLRGKVFEEQMDAHLSGWSSGGATVRGRRFGRF